MNVATLASREDWLAFRQRGIGASDAAAILGVSSWKGPLQLFYEKRGEAQASEGETFARRLGLALEQPIAKLYSQETNRTVRLPPAGTFEVSRHPLRPYMCATLDGRVWREDTEGALEIKTAVISKAQSWQDDPPIDYQVQVQHQLAVTGYRWGSLVALVGGTMLKYADIEADPEFIMLLEGACEEFWRRVELNDPPPADGTEATKDFLKKHYAAASPSTIALPPEAVDWDAQLEQAKADIKEATTRKTEAENLIKQAMGENSQATLPNGVIYTWNPQHRNGYTVEPYDFRDFRRKGGKSTRVRKSPGKVSIEDVAKQFEEEQQTESEW